jgi:hypothetical protein
METLTITLDKDELLGLNALVTVGLGTVSGNGEADPVSVAKSLIHNGLASRLDDLGLSWAPSPEEVNARSATLAVSRASSSPLVRLARSKGARRCFSAAVATSLLVVFWGGYADGWKWTGFSANDQLWDWLNLLLLPVVVGTIPIWLVHGERMSRSRRFIFAIVMLTFAGFVAIGYVVPLGWTGFRGNTLWNWFLLIVLPLSIVLTGLWPKSSRRLQPRHKVIITIFGVGWITTLIGGYIWAWEWTGYPGNTLWDWLQLLLLPLLLPTVLLPTALKWTTGDAANLAKEQAAMTHPAG